MTMSNDPTTQVINLSALPLPGPTSMTLRWVKPSMGDVIAYQVTYRKSDEAEYGPWTTITGSTADTTFTVVTGLERGTLYDFEIRPIHRTLPGANPAFGRSSGISMFAGLIDDRKERVIRHVQRQAADYSFTQNLMRSKPSANLADLIYKHLAKWAMHGNGTQLVNEVQWAVAERYVGKSINTFRHAIEENAQLSRAWLRSKAATKLQNFNDDTYMPADLAAPNAGPDLSEVSDLDYEKTIFGA